MRKRLTIVVTLVLAVACGMQAAHAGKKLCKKKLRSGLEKGCPKALSALEECNLEVKTSMVPELVSTYLHGDWNTSARARTLLLNIADAAPEAVVSEVAEQFRNAESDNVAVRLPAMELLADVGPAARHAMPALETALESSDFHIRQQALWAVSSVGSEARTAVPALVGLLKDDDALLRKYAMQTLRSVGTGPAVVPELAEALQSRYSSVRRFAFEALEALGPRIQKAVPALVDASRNGNFTLSLDAVRSAGLASSSAAAGAEGLKTVAALWVGRAIKAAQQVQADELRDALEEGEEGAVEDVEKASMAVKKALVPALIDVYLDGTWTQSAKAKSLLMNIGKNAPGSVVPRLMRRYRDADADDVAVRLPVMELLRDLGPAAVDAVPVLIDGVRSGDLSIQQQAVWALGAIGPEAEEAVPALMGLLDAEDALLRKDAVEALKVIGPDASAVEELADALSSDDSSVRRFAAEALADIGPDGEDAVPELIEVVETGGRFLQLEAIKALGAIGAGAEDAIPVLLKVSEGKSAKALETIQKALDNIKSANLPPDVQDVEATCEEGKSVTIDLPVELKDDVVTAIEAMILEEPEHGSLEQTGAMSFVYTCPRGYAGEDAFTWKVSDGKDESSVAEAVVEIAPDKDAPKLTTLAASGKNTEVRLGFSEPVAEDAAADAGSYSISGGVNVKKATLSKDGTNVTLATSPMSQDKPYVLTIKGLRDRAAAGNKAGTVKEDFKFFAWKRTGLVLLARAEGNAKDESGQNNHGKLTKGVSYASDGAIGQAWKFAGAGGNTENTVNFGDVAAMKAPGKFTIALWFKRAKDKSGSSNHDVSNILVSQGSDSDNDNLEIGTTGGSVQVYLDTKGNDNTESYDVGVKNGAWHHLAVTYDQGRDQVVQLYVDGKKVKGWSSWGGTLDDANGSPFTVGNTHHEETPFQGLIDELYVFKRAISAKEVNALYAQK